MRIIVETDRCKVLSKIAGWTADLSVLRAGRNRPHLFL